MEAETFMAVEVRSKRPVFEELKAARLYAVSSKPAPGKSYAEMADAALRGGADIFQLRAKHLPAKEIFELALELKKICEAHDALFIVNDRLDIALAAGAHGVHLGQDDLPVSEARKIVQAFFHEPRTPNPEPRFLIGCSTHSLAQALRAQEEGADYLGCGPVFPTPTKPSYPAQGLDLVRQYRDKVSVPFVAIGGIDETNIEQVKQAGSHCVAVVRAVFDQEDIESAARSLKQKLL